VSLIYDALRTAGDTPAAPGSQPARPRPARALPRGSVWLAIGVLLAGPLGFLVARGTGRSAAVDPPPVPIAATATPAPAPPAPLPQPAPAPAAAQAVAPAAIPAPAPAAVAIATPAEASPVPASPAAPAATPPATRPTAPMAAIAAPVPAQVPVPAPAPAAQPAAMPAMRIAVTSAAAPRAERTAANREDPDPAAVRGAMAHLHAAVGDHDDQAREQAIGELQKLLPADSLTLLRARAWAAHGSGDTAQAERLYGAILQRVPDDEYASVNLALIDARRGALDQARDRLNQLAARGPHSAMVDNALAELENARP